MYRLIPQWFVVFYQNFDKSYPTAADCTYYIYKLDNLGEFGKISPNDLKSAVKCLYTMYVNGDFSMSTVGWMEIIKILIISQSSLTTLTRLMLVGLLFDLIYQIFDKIYLSATCNSYNTSIIEPVSMDSSPNDKWGFGYLIGWFVGYTPVVLYKPCMLG